MRLILETWQYISNYVWYDELNFSLWVFWKRWHVITKSYCTRKIVWGSGNCWIWMVSVLSNNLCYYDSWQPLSYGHMSRIWNTCHHNCQHAPLPIWNIAQLAHTEIYCSIFLTLVWWFIVFKVVNKNSHLILHLCMIILYIQLFI